MWKASRVSKDFHKKLTLNAGTLLKRFDVDNPVAPDDDDIITETTGGVSVTCVPIMIDLFEDIDNVKSGTKQGQHITGWDAELTTTGLRVTKESIMTSLGACEETSTGAIVPTGCDEEDFTDLYWINDTTETATSMIVIVIKNAFSTGGFSLQTGKDTKGNLPLTFKGFYDIENQEDEPIEFYLLEKMEE